MTAETYLNTTWRHKSISAKNRFLYDVVDVAFFGKGLPVPDGDQLIFVRRKGAEFVDDLPKCFTLRFFLANFEAHAQPAVSVKPERGTPIVKGGDGA